MSVRKLVSSSSQLGQFSNIYESINTDPDNRDLVLVCGGVKLSYHQAIVFQHSSFLSGLAKSVVPTLNEVVVTLDSVNPVVLRILMDCIYSGKCDKVPGEVLFEVEKVHQMLGFNIYFNAETLNADEGEKKNHKVSKKTEAASSSNSALSSSEESHNNEGSSSSQSESQLSCTYCTTATSFGSKSTFLQHLSSKHFKKELIETYNMGSFVPYQPCLCCEKPQKNAAAYLIHVGASHKKVIQFLPEDIKQIVDGIERKVKQEKSSESQIESDPGQTNSENASVEANLEGIKEHLVGKYPENGKEDNYQEMNADQFKQQGSYLKQEMPENYYGGNETNTFVPMNNMVFKQEDFGENLLPNGSFDRSAMPPNGPRLPNGSLPPTVPMISNNHMGPVPPNVHMPQNVPMFPNGPTPSYSPMFPNGPMPSHGPMYPNGPMPPQGTLPPMLPNGSFHPPPVQNDGSFHPPPVQNDGSFHPSPAPNGGSFPPSLVPNDGSFPPSLVPNDGSFHPPAVQNDGSFEPPSMPNGYFGGPMHQDSNYSPSVPPQGNFNLKQEKAPSNCDAEKFPGNSSDPGMNSADRGLICSVCKNSKVFASRSSLLQHASMNHFRKFLVQKYSAGFVPGQKCEDCGKEQKNNTGFLVHIGSKHEKVMEFLPEEMVTMINNYKKKSTKMSKLEKKKIMKLEKKMAKLEKKKMSKLEKKKMAKLEKKKLAQDKKRKLKENGLLKDEKPSSGESSARGIRCTICQSDKVFPSKSNFMQHLSIKHFRSSITEKYLANFHPGQPCDKCQKPQKNAQTFMIHIGAFHKKVLGFLSDEMNSIIESMESTKKRKPRKSNTTINSEV